MPLVVNVLENLDSSMADNQDHLTALDELNEENQQLTKQYQREKQRRKEADEVCMCVFSLRPGSQYKARSCVVFVALLIVLGIKLDETKVLFKVYAVSVLCAVSYYESVFPKYVFVLYLSNL